MYVIYTSIKLKKNKYLKTHLPGVVSGIAGNSANTTVIVSLENKLAVLFKELRQVREVSSSDCGFSMYLIFVTPDTASIQQSLGDNTCIHVLKKGPPLHFTLKKGPTDRISGQGDWYISLLGAFSYLVRYEATTKMAQLIAAPKELLWSPNMGKILFSGSESKQHVDQLKLSSAPIYKPPRPAACVVQQTLCIVTNDEDTVFFALCFISVHWIWGRQNGLAIKSVQSLPSYVYIILQYGWTNCLDSFQKVLLFTKSVNYS